ncbi:MAG: hypothetical protein EOL87_18400 [Spartobacteria bacterium]|nr:hypothetical protein [Spartobacteria bacterium]
MATEETCAMTVLPCIQRGVEQLPAALRKRIRYTLGIMCSHNVPDQFADYMARRHAIFVEAKRV